ncbi:hypothetical protein [Nodularia spumigena]|uniref:hypothetical protein n=1 Tax=Nodularia spumigena TaxID=70799 RepID=UPI00232B745A|nr:hypothetical protein [Nodularia spumigena]MDB9500040.1 hypothetical protein [Nodularia spumigena CS-336/02]
MMIDEGCRYLRAAIGSDYNTYLRFRNSPMFWRFYVRRWAEMEFTLHRQLKTLQGHPEIYQSMHRKAMRPNIPGDLQKSMLKQMHYENALNST